MNQLTKVFLVLLRLAIGWHFLFEGIEKLQSVYVGPTETNRPFTSAGYLREAGGPLRRFFRRQVGDPDEEALALLTVTPLEPGQDPQMIPPHQRFPRALGKGWDDYFQRFADYYKLDSRQRQLAEKKLEQRKDQTVGWLISGEKVVKKTYPTGVVETRETTAQRIAVYRGKVQRVRDLEEKLRDFGRDVEHQNLRREKAELSRLRAELMADLGQETAEMKKALNDVLDPPQKKMDPLSEPPSQARWLDWERKDWIGWLAWWGLTVIGAGLLLNGLAQILRHVGEWGRIGVAGWLVWLALMGIGVVLLAPVLLLKIGPSWSSYSLLEWIDWLASWGLAMVGIGLLLGFLTRTACVAGAVFLLMLYLEMPPWPWLPENLRAEGHYFFVDKNLVEMLALLVLATTRSGRWAGLDGILQFLNPWRWRSQHPVREVGTGL